MTLTDGEIGHHETVDFVRRDFEALFRLTNCRLTRDRSDVADFATLKKPVGIFQHSQIYDVSQNN